MSLSGDNLYSILFIILFCVIVNKFLNSFNSKEVIILKNKKEKSVEKYKNNKISKILENKNIKCSGKNNDKIILKEKFYKL